MNYSRREFLAGTVGFVALAADIGTARPRSQANAVRAGEADNGTATTGESETAREPFSVRSSDPAELG
jgi:hypothetical protein